jgi:hypothetical protein
MIGTFQLLRGFGPAAMSTPAPSLAVTDNGDGTGAVATIADSDDAATNTVWIGTWGGESGTVEWSAEGSRTGDGTVDLDLEPGHYWAYVASELSGAESVSELVYFAVTDGVGSVHYRALLAAQARIQSLSLEGISSAHIIVRKLATDKDIGSGLAVEYPAIVLAQLGIENQPPGGGTNLRDDVEYPVLIAILAADNRDLVANQGRYLKWREQINRAFRNQRLTGVPEVYTVRVQPGPIVSPSSFWQNIYHSSIVLRCVSRESRGF